MRCDLTGGEGARERSSLLCNPPTKPPVTYSQFHRDRRNERKRRHLRGRKNFTVPTFTVRRRWLSKLLRLMCKQFVGFEGFPQAYMTHKRAIRLQLNPSAFSRSSSRPKPEWLHLTHSFFFSTFSNGYTK